MMLAKDLSLLSLEADGKKERVCDSKNQHFMDELISPFFYSYREQGKVF